MASSEEEQNFTEPAQHVLTISFHALRRARSTIEDFWLSYHPYHQLQLKDFFRWMDVLVWVEGTIYQVDEDNEHLSKQGSVSADLGFTAYEHIYTVLQTRGLLSDAVRAELGKGAAYWKQERLLCSLMLQHAAIPAQGHDPGFAQGDIDAASLGKSFDYRVLNLVVYALRGQRPNPLLLEFLRVDEHLVDIGDDLVDYEDDVARSTFNIYRGYVHLYGMGAELRLISRISQYEALHAKLLAQLEPQLRASYLARQQAAAHKPDALKWIFPSPILDEESFRLGKASAGEKSPGHSL